MIINLISCPRNISTAMMYSFARRSATKVIDEPFYAYYLEFTGLDHPGREDILQSMSSDPDDILNEIFQLEKKYEVLFLKNMAQHHTGLEWDYLISMRNVFLIRDPKQLITSFAQVITKPTLQDIGLKEEAELLDFVKEKGKFEPIVVDSNDILSDPESGLSSLCERVGIPFKSEMLSWEKGPIPEDGSWAKYWYKNVHNSTGFIKQKTSKRPLPTHCEPLLREAQPYYEKLKTYSSL
ncbi:MAG: sulfotransferase family protein [Ekhidna sp.]|nr:sulfotransferase family protein [Ekhidna sp.]